jgi:hypothetical protein
MNKKRTRSVLRIFVRTAACVIVTTAGAEAAVTITVDTSQNRRSISPYIYGVNWADDATVTALGGHIPLYRSGGNRWTGYNWENNASNSGTDWGPNSNDSYLSDSSVPGEAQRARIAAAHSRNAAALITIPIVDYVAADKSGLVYDVASPTNPRWRQSRPRKGSTLSLTPDTTDNYVNEDEHVNWVEHTFASARALGKQIFYSLDNEPALWPSTHPLIHPSGATYAEMQTRTIAAASMIKDLTPNAKVFGAVCYGFNEFINLQDAPDAAGRDYLNFIMDKWSEQETLQGRRIVDVLDLHWYPEATGGGVRICMSDSASPSSGEITARLQAPRSLWDSTYRETSWISDYLGSQRIRLIPRIKEQIAAHYPGTDLAFTEYYYGGANHISGALAQADVLGVFGREGVYAASLWGDVANYLLGGFAIFLNYDGAGHAVGDVSVSASNSDIAGASVYAMASSTDNTKLWVVAVNKTSSANMATLQITHAFPITASKVYRVTTGQSTPQAAGSVTVTNNQLSYSMPAYSVSTIELAVAAPQANPPRALRLRH